MAGTKIYAVSYNDGKTVSMTATMDEIRDRRLIDGFLGVIEEEIKDRIISGEWETAVDLVKAGAELYQFVESKTRQIEEAEDEAI